MKRKQPKKDSTQNIDVFHYLKDELNYAISNIKTEYQIEINTSRMDEFIKQITESTPEEVSKIMKVTSDVINYLSSDGFKLNPENIPPRVNIDFLHLLRAALSGNLTVYFRPEMKKAFPKDSLCLCYTIIYSQALLRLFLYFNDHPITRDVLYAFYGEILEANLEAEPFLTKALENLSQIVRKEYKNITRQEPETGGEEEDYNKKLYSAVWEAVKEAFSPSLEENIIKTAKGDKKVSYAPHRVTTDLIDEYNRYMKIIDPDWGYNSDESRDLRPIELVSDVSKLPDIEKASDLKGWIETLEDPIDREIASLKCIEVPKITVRELEERLDIPKSTIYDRLRKLRKLKPRS